MIAGNRILIEKINEQDNILMSKRLQNCKPRINSSEPIAFRNFHKMHRKGELENFNDYCKRMNDLSLFKKLEDIYTGKASK